MRAPVGPPVPRPAARRVLGLRVDATSYEDAADRVVGWARAGDSRYVCAANVHMVMEAHDSPEFREAVNGADLVTPDGMPLVWALRLLGVPHATRVYGPDLTRVLCARAAREGLPVGFHGGAPAVLGRLMEVVGWTFPRLRVAYAGSPPFRPLAPDEEARELEGIDACGARILFVGLGCPKQERWMARHRGRIGAVMVGVGAAFDFLSGHKRQAPAALQAVGLEWGFRLLAEPRRLGRRYLYHNPRFVALFGAELLRERLRAGGRDRPADGACGGRGPTGRS